jgi:hypothetical protein
MDPWAKRAFKIAATFVVIIVTAVLLGPLWWMAPLGYFLALLAIRKLSILDDGYLEDREVRKFRKELKDK